MKVAAFAGELAGIKHGSTQQEFQEMAFPIMDRLFNTALKMTRNPLDAEDLVQDTYLKAYRFFHRFERGSNFPAWMFRILTNSFITAYQKKKRQPQRVDFETTCSVLPDEDPKGNSDKERFDEIPDYSEVFDDTVSAALDRLPEEYRIVVLLADVNGLKYKEIAKVLGCPQGTVMSRLSRGRGMLARFLKSYALRNGFVKPETGDTPIV